MTESFQFIQNMVLQSKNIVKSQTKNLLHVYLLQ